MRKSRRKRIDLNRPYLVAEPTGFPGVRIPLLSDEEREARGIPKAEFPPFETWSPEQQLAGRKLADALFELARTQALRLMLQEIERIPQDSQVGIDDVEPMAAARAIERIDAGEWKPEAWETHGLGSYVRLILEMFANRQVSILVPPAELKKAKRRMSRSAKAKRSKGA